MSEHDRGLAPHHYMEAKKKIIRLETPRCPGCGRAGHSDCFEWYDMTCHGDDPGVTKSSPGVCICPKLKRRRLERLEFLEGKPALDISSPDFPISDVYHWLEDRGLSLEEERDPPGKEEIIEITRVLAEVIQEVGGE